MGTLDADNVGHGRAGARNLPTAAVAVDRRKASPWRTVRRRHGRIPAVGDGRRLREREGYGPTGECSGAVIGHRQIQLIRGRLVSADGRRTA
jgi:hypothetical protein